MELVKFNILATLTAAVLAFVLGGIWYSPKVFLPAWKRAAGMQDDSRHSLWVFVQAYICYLISAGCFAYVLGPNPSLQYGILLGILTGIGWVATSFGINYGFARRPARLFFIDAGYHLLQFVCYGIVLGLWHG